MDFETANAGTPLNVAFHSSYSEFLKLTMSNFYRPETNKKQRK